MQIFLSQKAAIGGLFKYLQERRARGETVHADCRAIIKRHVARHPDRSTSQGFIVHVLEPARDRVTL